MRIVTKRKIRFGVVRLGGILKKAGVIAAAALAVRFLLGMGALGRVEEILHRTGNNPDFIKTALMMELPGAIAQPDGGREGVIKNAITADSAVFLAYDRIMNEDAAEVSTTEPVSFAPYPSEEPPPSVSPPPATPAAAPSAAPEPSVTPQDAPTVSAGGNPIEAINISPVDPYGYESYGGVFINNAPGMDIDAEAIVTNISDLAITGEGPHVLIVHTHGSEAYTPAGEDIYDPTDIERTEDTNYNVVRVGDEMERILKEKGISVVHDRNIYDYPSYNGAYTRTLEAITARMKETPSIKVIIDVHRDSMTASNGTVYKTIADINGERAAQVMLVMGTNKGGLSHNNWKKNLTFGVEIQKYMADNYPGLARPINMRKERFNQHVTAGSMLVEIGTAGNTLREALAGARLFADSAGEVILNHTK